MDSSELTKSRRDRVIANSFSSNGIASRHLVPQITSSNLLSFKYGSKLVEFNKKTVLPNCGGTSCTQDVVGYTSEGIEILEPPNPSISYNLPPCPIDQPTEESYSVTFGPGTPLRGTFSITVPGSGSNPATLNAESGVLTIPLGIDPSGVYTITYTVGSIVLQTNLDLQGC